MSEPHVDRLKPALAAKGRIDELELPSDFGTHLALHEVHYAKDGTPGAYTVEPASFVAGSGEANDIAGALAMALSDAKERPVWPIASFPGEV